MIKLKALILELGLVFNNNNKIGNKMRKLINSAIKPLTILFFLILLISSKSIAQDASSEDSQKDVIKSSFPITVIDMQYIVSRSAAAVEIRKQIEAKKELYAKEIKNEEEILKSLQEELSAQRSILPPDEFASMEAEFRTKVEKLQTKVAEINKELESILNKSISALQRKTIEIVTRIARDRGLAAVLDTSTVVIAADSINISGEVLKVLNEELPVLELNAADNNQEQVPSE